MIKHWIRLFRNGLWGVVLRCRHWVNNWCGGGVFINGVNRCRVDNNRFRGWVIFRYRCWVHNWLWGMILWCRNWVDNRSRLMVGRFRCGVNNDLGSMVLWCRMDDGFWCMVFRCWVEDRFRGVVFRSGGRVNNRCWLVISWCWSWMDDRSRFMIGGCRCRMDNWLWVYNR